MGQIANSLLVRATRRELRVDAAALVDLIRQTSPNTACHKVFVSPWQFNVPIGIPDAARLTECEIAAGVDLDLGGSEVMRSSEFPNVRILACNLGLSIVQIVPRRLAVGLIRCGPVGDVGADHKKKYRV